MEGEPPREAVGPAPPVLPPTDPDADLEDPSAIVEVASEKLGVEWRDRPAIYAEVAEAATDTTLPFWCVLLLSGAIATVGLALNATAVVIGAMLIAPLMGPLLGLSLALAIGDGRLAVQTFLTIFLGAAGVVLFAALLTVVLPFQDVTAEIAARTRPTTLDLAIAVFSGFAGGVVTISREHRLSASIPGVAIAVALIPPLSVAGFGIGTGWQWSLIHGSLLLFGANLGGIVLSGMAVFFMVGMHRPIVLETARHWHESADPPGLAGWLSRIRVYSRLRVFDSTWARVGLVLAFVAAVAVPLTTTLEEVVREARVERAVSHAVTALDENGEASVFSRDVVLGKASARVHLRVATKGWIDGRIRQDLERTLSAIAGEPVTLVLEQLVTSEGGVQDPSALFPSRTAPPADPAATTPEEVLDRLQVQLGRAFEDLSLPDDVRVLGVEVAVGREGMRLHVAYAAPRRMPAVAEAMLVRQTADLFGLDPEVVSTRSVATGPRPLPADSSQAAGLAELLGRFSVLRIDVVADSADAARTRDLLLAVGVPPARVAARPGTPARLHLRVEE